MTRSAVQRLHAGSPQPERRGTRARPAARAGEAGAITGQCLAIVQHCLAGVVARAGDARGHDDPEAIHQLRVAIRRLRAAIAILRRYLPSMQLMAINAQLRDFQQALGAAREWDVLIDQTVASMPKRMRSSRSMRRFIAAAEARRGEGHERARAALTSHGEAGFLPALKKDIAKLTATKAARRSPAAPGKAPPEPFGAFAGGVLRARHRKARKLGKRLTELDAQGLHAFRIRIKKLRYAAQFLRHVWPGRGTEQDLARLADLQQVLGSVHDDAVAIELAGTLEAGGSPGISRASRAVRNWAAKCLARDRKRLARRWKKFERRKRFWKS